MVLGGKDDDVVAVVGTVVVNDVDGGVVSPVEVGAWLMFVQPTVNMLQPFLCFFFHWDLFIYFFNLVNFYPVTRFLVTPLLVTRYCVTLFSNTFLAFLSEI